MGTAQPAQDDIVTRLRLWATVEGGDSQITDELHNAADEIERLRMEVRELRSEVQRLTYA